MKFDPKKTIFLIDGSSFLYRAYYGLKPLHTSAGIPVQAVFSFCRMIKKLIDTYGPEYVALVWDSKGKTTRHEMFTEYKATRQAPPSDLFDQKKYIVECADLIGMRQMEQSGIEADDIMFSVAKERAEQGDTVIFVTLDKDMGQALTLNDHIYLFDAFKEQFSDRSAIEKKMGFVVEKMPFYFALLGDASDNIPGVKGIGQKTAVDLVNQFDSLEDMYDRLHEIKKAGVKTALLTYKDNAFLSRDLFLLQYHPTGLSEKDYVFDAKNWNKARPLFEQLNFKSMLAEFGQTKEERATDISNKIAYWKQRDFRVVQTSEQLEQLCAHLIEQGSFAVDTETTGLQALTVGLVGISFCAHNDVAYYIPCGHKTDEPQLPIEKVLAALKPILENPIYKKYLHNAKYDELVFSSHGIELAGLEFDTLIAANLIIQEWQSASLKNLSHHYFNEEMITYDDVVKASKLKDFSYVSIDIATLYSCADSYQTFRLVDVIEKEFAKEKKIEKLYQEIELPLVDVLYKMEKTGIFLDVPLLHALDKKVAMELITIKAKIVDVVGVSDINLNSPSQIEDLLFYKLQLPPQKKSPKGKYSTDQEVLTALAALHPVPALIIKYRELAKLKSTYIDALPTFVNPHTDRVHTTFSQTTAATGRLASSNPNLQNIPADGTTYGIEIRAAFQPPQGHLFIAADYSQIELRVLAYLSQDPTLLRAFLMGQDIHSETAALLCDVPLESVTHEQRQLGKRINFSILYGLTPYGLSKDLGIPFKDAKRYIDRYFEKYPQVAAWMNDVIEATKKHGYTETLWGRRRYIPAIHERNRTMYEEACRIAINTVGQGTAAEVMKKGMVLLEKELIAYGDQVHIVLQIHDELLISAPQDKVNEVEAIVKKVLESVVDWNVPLTVTTSVGADWKQVTL